MGYKYARPRWGSLQRSSDLLAGFNVCSSVLQNGPIYLKMFYSFTVPSTFWRENGKTVFGCNSATNGPI